MDGYDKFQQIIAELKYKIEKEKDKNNPPYDVPPGFEELFRNLSNHK